MCDLSMWLAVGLNVASAWFLWREKVAYAQLHKRYRRYVETLEAVVAQQEGER